MEIPIIPYEIETVSLIGLCNFVSQNPERFEDLDITVLNEYLHSYKNEEYYYLGGKIKINKDEPITQIHMQLVHNDYSIPMNEIFCDNSFEEESIRTHRSKFEKFMVLFTSYYSIQLEIEYAPGGPVYERLASQTIIGKK